VASKGGSGKKEIKDGFTITITITYYLLRIESNRIVEMTRMLSTWGVLISVMSAMVVVVAVIDPSGVLMVTAVESTPQLSSPSSSSSSHRQRKKHRTLVSTNYDYPTYTPTLLNTSLSYRQNVCDRHAQFYNGTVPLKNALQGLQLRPHFISGIGGYSSSVNDQDGSIPSKDLLEDTTHATPIIRILDVLSDRAGFTWRNSYGVSSLVTAKNNSTISIMKEGQEETETKGTDLPTIDEILQWSVDTFDLVAMDVVRTQERTSNGISFLEGYVDASIIMVGTSESRPNIGLLLFLQPFDWQVWVLTIFTFALAALGYQWMEWLNDGDSDRSTQLLHHPSETLYYSFMAFTGDCKFEPRTNPARIFVFTIAFWGLILCSAYTGSLASFLVAQNTPLLLVETIGDAVAANYPLCVIQGAVPETEIRKVYPQANLVTVPLIQANELFTKVLSGDCTLAVTTMNEWEKAKHDGSINHQCQLQWIGRTFKFSKVGFVTMSDSGTLCSNLIRDVLSVYISEMLDDGTIKGIIDDYSKSTKTNTCSDGGSTSDNNKSNGGGSGGSSSNSNSNSNVDTTGSATQSLSLWDLGGLFIIVYLVWILASIIAMMNWYLRKRNRKRNRQQDNNNEDAIGRTAEGDEDGNVATDTSSMFSNHNDSTIDHNRQKQQQQQQQLRFQPDGIKNNININLLNNSIQNDDTESSMNNNTNNQNTNTNNTHTNFTPSERDQLAFQLDSMRQQMEEMQTLLLLKVPVQKK